MLEIALPIIKIVVILLCGYVYTYVSTKINISSKIAAVIARAEDKYTDAQKSGSEKMEYAIDLLYTYVPIWIRPILTKEVLKSLIQTGFDEVQKYANAQLDKIVAKVNDTVTTDGINSTEDKETDK